MAKGIVAIFKGFELDLATIDFVTLSIGLGLVVKLHPVGVLCLMRIQRAGARPGKMTADINEWISASLPRAVLHTE